MREYRPQSIPSDIELRTDSKNSLLIWIILLPLNWIGKAYSWGFHHSMQTLLTAKIIDRADACCATGWRLYDGHHQHPYPIMMMRILTMILTMMLMITATTWTLANEDQRNNSLQRSQRRHTVGRTSCQRVERWQEKRKEINAWQETHNLQNMLDMLFCGRFLMKTYMF